MSDPLTKRLTREGVDRLSEEWNYGRGQLIVPVTLPTKLEIPRSRFMKLKQDH